MVILNFKRKSYEVQKETIKRRKKAQKRAIQKKKVALTVGIKKIPTASATSNKNT